MAVVVCRRSLFGGIRQLRFDFTFKPVYNDHPWDRQFVAVVGRWWLLRGSFGTPKWWSLLGGIRSLRFDCTLKLVYNDHPLGPKNSGHC